MPAETPSQHSSSRRIEILPNGLTVILQRVPQYPVVEFNTWVRVGPVDEKSGEGGLAHFLEHMVFNGNELYTIEEYRKTLFILGADDNAETSNDMTAYQLGLPSEHFEKGLELHHALVLLPRLSDEDFHREREIIFEEMHRQDDDPEILVYIKTLMATFPHLNYNHPILGTEKSLKGITAEAMREFYRKHYSAEKMLLAIVGDVDFDRAMPLIREKYGKLKSSTEKHAKQEIGTDTQTEPRLLMLSGDIDSTYLCINFKAPPLENMETYALDVLMDALGGNRTSRIPARIYEDSGLVTEIEASNLSMKDASILGIEAEPGDSSDTQRVIDEIFGEINKVLDSGFTEGELDRVKNGLLVDRVFRNETLDGICEFYGTPVLLIGLENTELYLDRILSVTSDQVNHVASKYLRPENMTLGVIRPSSENTEISLAAFDPEKKDPQKISLPFGEITTSFPVPGMRSEGLGEVIREELSNGIVWLYQRNPANPTVAVDVFIRGGLGHETWDTNGIVQMVQGALWKGTNSRPVRELNLEIDSLGAIMETDSVRDYLSIESLFLSRDFEQGFDILSDMVLNPVFPEDEIEKVRKDVIGGIVQEEDDAYEVALRVLRHEIFGPDHPYGRPYFGRVETVDKLTLDEVKKFHAEVFSAENIVISVVGDIDRERASKLVTEKFGSLKRSGKTISVQGRPTVPEGIKVLTTPKEKAQVMLMAGRVGPSVTDPDFPAAVMTEAIIGGNTYSRLYTVLRERMGLAYVVYSTLQYGMFPALFFSYVGTTPENMQTALDGIRREYGKLVREGPNDREIREALGWLRGDTLMERQGNRSLAEDLGSNEAMGVAYDFELRLLDEVKSITCEEIKESARKYCDPDNLVVSIYGPVNEQKGTAMNGTILTGK